MLSSKKILVSLVVITLLVVTFGSINSLATSITADVNSGNSVGTITISGNTAASGTQTNTAENNVVNNTANNTTNNVVNRITNSSSYNTTNTNSVKSSLPYAGTNSSVIFVVIALAISAIYAYRKVSDYNV
jgi:ABC-type transport system involved in multi-copper enzyme maturation permease subunit